MIIWCFDFFILYCLVYLLLVESYVCVIGNGLVLVGMCLLLQWWLVDDLGLLVQIVLCVYEELIWCGLVVGEVGCGLFVLLQGVEVLSFYLVEWVGGLVDLLILKLVIECMYVEIFCDGLYWVVENLISFVVLLFCFSLVLLQYCGVVVDWLWCGGIDMVFECIILIDGVILVIIIVVMSVVLLGGMLVVVGLMYYLLMLLCKYFGLQFELLFIDYDGIVFEVLDYLV